MSGSIPNIVTITFSPCIDKSISVPALIPEKKLICSPPILEPGGGGINVARAIHKLGGNSIAVFPSGGYTGKFLEHLIKKENIPSLIIEANKETRENIIVFDETTGNQFRLGMPGTELDEKEWKQCLKAVEEIKEAAFIIASGSLPPGVPLNIYAELAKIAKNKKAKFVVDTSGDALKYAVDEGVYLLKPNLRELSHFSARDTLQEREAVSVAKDIIEQGKCEIVVVSMGAKGALLVTDNFAEIIKAPPVIRISTVGAGDSMVAGIIYYLSLGKNITDAVQFGVACGTAATMNPGTELCKKEDADKLFNQIKKEEIPMPDE